MDQNSKNSPDYDLPGHHPDEAPTVRAVPSERPAHAAGVAWESTNLRLVIGLAIALAFMAVIVISQGLRQHALEVDIARQKTEADAAAARKLDEANKAEAARVADETRRAEEEARQAKERADREAQSQRESQLSELDNRLTNLQTSLDTVTSESADYDSKIIAYMTEHQDACIALFAGAAGGAAAFSKDEKISDESKALGGLTAAAALIWALQHQDEVSAVSSELSKASVIRANYASRESDLKQTIADVQNQIDALKVEQH